ncbi:transposase [Mesorhizobium onobrychidis]|uniref:Transposase n=1 Tax=Mesorhizobium onobrychidis TaxID=2775404 RepID=A0ABY5R6Y6_9HYPH|nr:transposase [Mesorhizobium onobrychidis]
MIADTLEPNAIISEVARRYGLRPRQVSAWRREARKKSASVLQDILLPSCRLLCNHPVWAAADA